MRLASTKTAAALCGGLLLAMSVPASAAVDAKLLDMLKANGSISQAQYAELQAELAKDQKTQQIAQQAQQETNEQNEIQITEEFSHHTLPSCGAMDHAPIFAPKTRNPMEIGRPCHIEFS